MAGPGEPGGALYNQLPTERVNVSPRAALPTLPPTNPRPPQPPGQEACERKLKRYLPFCRSLLFNGF